MLRPDQTSRAVTYVTADGVTVTVIPPDDVPKLYRAAIYCRVSTMHNEQQESLEAQLDYYTRYVHAQRAMVLVGVYADTKSARSIHARKDFERLLQDCRDGKIDIIVTKSISRFGRNTVDTLQTLRELQALKVNVIFENEGIESLDENGELIITLLSAIAQAESENRSTNIKWGIKQSAKNPDAHIYARPQPVKKGREERPFLI